MKYFIGALVGAVIGYITNWLAIKMLFRPYEEKRIFGFKIPFTPGLIPKERKRIAKSVGEAIGGHLLTKETILNSLCSDKINDALSLWVKREVTTLEESELTVEANLKELLASHYGEVRADIKDNITDIVLQGIKSEKFKIQLSELLKREVNNLLKLSPNKIMTTKEYIKFKNTLSDLLSKNIQSDEVKGKLTNIITNKLISMKDSEALIADLVPSTVVGNIKVYVYNNRYHIGKYIENILREEKYEIKIKGIIQNVVSTQMNPMMAMFVNPDSIYSKIVSGASEMLQKEENLMDVVLLLNEIISNITKTKVKDIVENNSEEGNHLIGEKVSEVLINSLNNSDLIIELINSLENNLSNHEDIGSLLENINIDIEESSIKYIIDNFEGLTKRMELKEVTGSFVDSAMTNLEAMKMKKLFTKEGRDLSTKISSIVLKLYSSFIENKALEFIELFNVAQVVEEKINEFEVTYAEEIILEIASKELSAITWLGGVLGGILGILSPILSSLY